MKQLRFVHFLGASVLKMEHLSIFNVKKMKHMRFVQFLGPCLLKTEHFFIINVKKRNN